MSPTPIDNSTSRKRKLSGNTDQSAAEGSIEKRSRLSTAKSSIVGAWNWFAEGTKRAFTRESLTQPLNYVNKVWDELSQSFGQNCEYQGPELEGPELSTSAPAVVPMSNVNLTANLGAAPSSSLATNTTFINLAPQPSLTSFAASSSMPSVGNSNLNHPLQSLHAMHPGGGDILSSEVSNHEAAAAAAALVAHQQQCIQLSLSRANAAAAEAGKFSTRGNNGFAPNGFSTPIMAVSGPQSRITNRPAFSLGAHVTAPLTQFKAKLQERVPIRIKKSTPANTTHEKLFSTKPVTSLRPTTRPDSPSVPAVFRHLMKRVRRKPYTVENNINLTEKRKYQELLRANGFKFLNSAFPSPDSSVSSREPRSGASSIVTIGSRNSDSSHSPPIAPLPSDGSWKPVTPSGSKLRPIKLDADDDEEETQKSLVAKNSHVEITLDDEPSTTKVSPPDGAAAAAVAPDAADEILLDDDDAPSGGDGDASTTDLAEGDASDVVVEKEVRVVETASDAAFDVVVAAKASTPSSTSSSTGKAAFFVEKEIPGATTVDLTGEREKVDTPPSQFEKKTTIRRVPVPIEPEFVKSARQSPYTDPKWIANMKHSYTVDRNKNDVSAREQEAHLEVLRRDKEQQDKDLLEQIQNKLNLSRRIKPPQEEVFSSEESEEEEEEEEEEDKDFPTLTDEMQDAIDEATNPNPPMAVLSSAFKLDITRKDIRTLVGLEWLNDEIINFYMNMLVDRSEKSEGALPKVYAFNTFFYPTLMKDGYSRLKRWTRRVDLFAHDIVIVPVHLQMHWCLAVIDLENKEIRYYDSMGGNNQKCLNALKEYLLEEHKDKKKGALDLQGWRYECVKDIPQQMNGSDCGMFACKFAEYVTRRAPFNFSQDHMPYFRRRMIHEILTLKLM